MVRWWQTVLVCVITLVLAVSVRNDFLFFLFGFELMTIVASLIFVYLQSRHISIRVRTDSQIVQVGETFKVRAVLTNDSRLPVTRLSLRLAVRAFPEKDWLLLKGRISLAAGETGAMCFELDGTHVQALEIRADRLVIEDYLGIARRRVPVHTDDIYNMYILPGADRAETALPETDRHLAYGSGDEVKAGGSDVDVSEIRQYTVGDPVKLIHWKLSARLDDPMVRSMTDPAERYVWIFLNLDEKGSSSDMHTTRADMGVRRTPDKWDHFIRTVSALSLSLLDADNRHMVCWVNAAAGRSERMYVSDELSCQSMLKALLRTDTYLSDSGSDTVYTKLLEEIFANESKEMCIEVDLQGHTFRSGRAG